MTLLVLDPPRVRQVTRWLFALIAFLGVANAAALVARHGLGYGGVFGLVPFFDLKLEESLGTWVASLTLAVAGLLALACASADERSGGGWRRNWRLLAAVLVFMSIDEIGTLHEGIADPLRRALNVGGALEFAWVIPAAVLGLLFLAVQLRFLRALPAATARGLVVAGAVFVLGAAGLEMVEAWILVEAGGVFTLAFDAFSMVEELLELSAVAWVMRTLGLHVTEQVATGPARRPVG